VSPNRTSVELFMMTTSHTATERFRREKWAGTESTESDDIWKFVAGRLTSLCRFEQRHGDHKVQDFGEVEMLLHEVW
jgi:hypothetical protein